MLVDNVVVILGKVVVNEEIDHNIRVRWFVPLDATYVHCRLTSILYKIDIYDGLMDIMANKLFPYEFVAININLANYNHM
jgi:hypothetical protein